jgi:hypothetical protein
MILKNILIYLHITILICENVQYIPIDKYQEYKIKKISKNSYKFSLDIRNIKVNDFIYLDYLSSVILEIDPFYYWSKDNYKNVSSYSNYTTKHKCQVMISEMEVLGEITYSIHCKVQKINSSYNTLIIDVNTENYKNVFLEISHSRFSHVTKVLFIIGLIIGIILFFVIYRIYQFLKKKKYCNVCECDKIKYKFYPEYSYNNSKNKFYNNTNENKELK